MLHALQRPVGVTDRVEYDDRSPASLARWGATTGCGGHRRQPRPGSHQQADDGLYRPECSTVSAGGQLVNIAATSSETMLSVTAHARRRRRCRHRGNRVDCSVITTDTEAYVGNKASLLGAAGAVTVDATSSFFTTLIAGAVGVGGTAGIGAANSTLIYGATTKADTGTKARPGDSRNGTVGGGDQESENVLAIVAGIAAGGTAGVAGSATVNVLTEVTTADVGAGSTITVTAGATWIVAGEPTRQSGHIGRGRPGGRRRCRCGRRRRCRDLQQEDQRVHRRWA